MGKEIEHKYLVKNEMFKQMASSSTKIKQGYLSREPSRTVRVRTKAHTAFLTIKGITTDDTRDEFEYEIPYEDGVKLLAMCQPPIVEKTRYLVKFDDMVWEVDQFHGNHDGLVTAEVELPYSGYAYNLPPFVGKNVTGDPRYYNSNL